MLVMVSYCMIGRPFQPLSNIVQLQSGVIVVNVLIIVFVHTALCPVLLLCQQSTYYHPHIFLKYNSISLPATMMYLYLMQYTPLYCMQI